MSLFTEWQVAANKVDRARAERAARVYEKHPVLSWVVPFAIAVVCVAAALLGAKLAERTSSLGVYLVILLAASAVMGLALCLLLAVRRSSRS